MNIHLSLPFVLACAGTAASWYWCSRQDYRGDYNFTAIYSLPVAALGTALSWMLYFAWRAFAS